MHDRESFELYFLARGEGTTAREAAKLAGVAPNTARAWNRGRPPPTAGRGTGPHLNVRKARYAGLNLGLGGPDGQEDRLSQVPQPQL